MNMVKFRSKRNEEEDMEEYADLNSARGGTKLRKENGSKVVERPFDRVKPGDKGFDFIGKEGTVIGTGTYEGLRGYHSSASGNCKGLTPLQKRTMVVVGDESGNKFLYVYGQDGFAVWDSKESL
jgi:hypothetical protein